MEFSRQFFGGLTPKKIRAPVKGFGGSVFCVKSNAILFCSFLFVISFPAHHYRVAGVKEDLHISMDVFVVEHSGTRRSFRGSHAR